MAHKYAQFELERRWLLASLPEALQNSQEYQLIEDRYLSGTPLRLRRMSDANGQVTALKLTQKYQRPIKRHTPRPSPIFIWMKRATPC